MSDTAVVLTLLLVALIFGIGGAMFDTYGREGRGFALGFLLGPIGILIVAVLRGQAPAGARPATAVNSVPVGMKKCPDCAEVIQGEARKCRYCGADVSAVRAAEAPVRAPIAQMACWNCGTRYDVDLTGCPHCGKGKSPPKARQAAR